MINKIASALKQSIEESLKSLQGSASPNVKTEWDGNVLKATVDALQDFDIRVKEKREPPEHTVQQGVPFPPTQIKKGRSVRGYTRKTKNGKQRIAGYKQPPKRPDRREAMQELQDWSFEYQERTGVYYSPTLTNGR